MNITAVVKLGGSLAEAMELPRWLRACAAARGQVVIVPGGGPYADAVRRAQSTWGFPDVQAHAMAVTAMEQFGSQLLAMQPALRGGDSVRSLRACADGGETAVWMARCMVLADPSITQDWNMTSDSLAAWLAWRLDVGRLFLVKSVRVDACADAAALAQAGVVDAEFPRHARGLAEVRVLHRDDWALLPELLGRAPAEIFRD